MSRKSKQSKSAAHKQQKAQAKNRAAMKERLPKRQHRHESFYGFLQEAYDLYDDGEYEQVRVLLLQKFAQNPRAESDESLELLADTAVQLRDYPTIAKVYRKLTARVPDEVHFQVNCAADVRDPDLVSRLREAGANKPISHLAAKHQSRISQRKRNVIHHEPVGVHVAIR